MPRIAKNQLQIIPLVIKGQDTGLFVLDGRLNGQRIRLKHADPIVLQTKKRELENPVLEQLRVEASGPQIQKTYLSEAQLRDAEAAYNLLTGKSHTLKECVLAAMGVLGDGKAKDALEAKCEFIAWQEKRGLSSFTIDTNRRRIEEFIDFAGIKMLGEISPAHCEDFVQGTEEDDYEAATKTGRGRPIQTWLNWCVLKKAKKPSYLKKSPYEVDMKELNEKASLKTFQKKRMYSADKCEALLKAAINYNQGEMVAYTLLALPCYMRHAEVIRTQLHAIHIDAHSSLEGPFVEVYGSKKGSKPRAVSIPANFVPLLKECIERHLIRAEWWREPGKKYSAEQLKKLEKLGDVPFTRHGWDKIREAAGIIKFGGLTKNKYRKVLWTDWQENILRHTGESFARRQKDDAARTSESAGHARSTADKHYICVPVRGDTEKFYGLKLHLNPVKKEAVA